MYNLPNHREKGCRVLSIISKKAARVNSAMLKGTIVKAGFTQDEVADKLGLSPTAFNNKVNNKSEFKASEIKRLTVILNLTRDEVDLIFFDYEVD